jgi:alkylation response protein AidB-like acyl-CoA dehydrogenase
MRIAEAPSGTELVGRASELAPLLRKNALWSEENRRLPEETIQAVIDAGILRMRLPARYGGYESDMRTVVDVIAQLGRGDGSAAWTVSTWAVSSFVVGLFPDEVQDEVFADPDVRVSGILSPTAMAVPAEGGYVVSGRWSFNSGCLQSQWTVNAVLIGQPDGSFEPATAAIPLADLQIVDDWHTAGLRGTGSVSTVAEELFVPADRMLPMIPLLQGRHRSILNAGSRVYQMPLMPAACTMVSAPAVGLAKAAQEAFFERLPGRKITYTDYARQSEAPLTHLQVAEARINADEAEFHAHRAADLLDSKALTGAPWTVEERARVRLDLGAVCLRAKKAVDILNSASGGSSIYSDVAIQRIERDIQAINLHAILHPDTNFELYGRIACGLAPNTQYL